MWGGIFLGIWTKHWHLLSRYLIRFSEKEYEGCKSINHTLSKKLVKFGNEFWLILFREYISPKLFVVYQQQTFVF